MDGLCDCGWPRHICQNPDNDGWFEAKRTTCYSKQAVDQITQAEKYKPDAGELIFTEYTRPADEPLKALQAAQ